ncbi:3'-5' exonuclease, partial [Nitrosomonas communis]|uniref:3'-5' exonuclease n=1 Tax=Nitrosomonas communis TaxID=44574 RepID=UPI0026EA6ACB
EDSAPRLMPVSAGRQGPKPLLIKLPSLAQQARYIAQQLKAAHQDGMAWKDMAVLYRHWDPIGKTINNALTGAGIPFSRKDTIQFSEKQDTVRLLTFHSSKGLEFPLVAIPRANMQVDAGMSDEEEACLLYVAMTRATRELIVLDSAETV